MTVYPKSAAGPHVMYRDLFATLFVAGAVATYLFAGMSVRATAAIVFAFGMAGCIAGGTEMEKVYKPGKNRPLAIYAVVMSIAGVVAFVAAIAAMIGGADRMVDVLITMIVMLWLMATVRHASAATR